MNEKELVFWLKGYLDACTIEGKISLTQEQVEEINSKVNKCFIVHKPTNVNTIGWEYWDKNINWGGGMTPNYKKY
jgi:hypothetical protein